MLQFGKEVTLYGADGTEVKAKPKYRPGSKLADGLQTDDGRIINCQDEQAGTFWFDDTQERLTLTPPN